METRKEKFSHLDAHHTGHLVMLRNHQIDRARTAGELEIAMACDDYIQERRESGRFHEDLGECIQRSLHAEDDMELADLDFEFWNYVTYMEDCHD